MIDSEYMESIHRKADQIGAFLDYPPRTIGPDDLNALGDRLRRLADDAYMQATARLSVAPWGGREAA